jgi:hypothetical protein
LEFDASGQEGKVTEYPAVRDDLTMMAQLGVPPRT